MGIVIGEDFDFLHDDRLARRLRRKGFVNKGLKVNSNNQSLNRALKDQKLDGGMDEDYACFLNQVLEGNVTGQDFDFLLDDSMVRRLRRKRVLNKELKVNCFNQSLKRALGDQKLDGGMVDEDCAQILNQKLEDRQSLKRVLEDPKLDGCMVDEDYDSGEDDPDYKMFWEKLKEDGKSYVLQVAVKNEVSSYMKYEAEDSSDDECETPRMRKSRSVTDSESLEATNTMLDMTSEPVNHISGKEIGFSIDNPCPINSELFEVGSEHETEVEMVDESYQIYLDGISGIADSAVPATEDAELVEHKKMDDKCTSESEVLVALNASDFHDGNYCPFETSKPRNILLLIEDEDGLLCSGDPNKSSRSWYREKLMEKLSESYDQEEHNKLWKDITEQKPKERVFHFRSGLVKTCKKHTEPGGPSYLAQYRDLEEKINEVSLDKYKELNLLRGFFFWLQNLVQNDAFYPWLDPRCLEVMPRNSM